MPDKKRAALVDYIAANPEAGVSLGGGLRKVRIACEGGGKSGGFRTIYVFGGMRMLICLVTVFAKKEKDNLGKSASRPNSSHSASCCSRITEIAHDCL